MKSSFFPQPEGRSSSSNRAYPSSLFSSRPIDAHRQRRRHNTAYRQPPLLPPRPVPIVITHRCDRKSTVKLQERSIYQSTSAPIWW